MVGEPGLRPTRQRVAFRSRLGGTTARFQYPIRTIQSALESHRIKCASFELSIIQSLETRLNHSQNSTEFQIDILYVKTPSRAIDATRSPSSRCIRSTPNNVTIT